LLVGVVDIKTDVALEGVKVLVMRLLLEAPGRLRLHNGMTTLEAGPTVRVLAG